jgi:hypothetical protein
MVVDQVNWEHEVLTDPESVREWLYTQADRGIEHLCEDGALMYLMGGPTATSYLQLHVASGCVFHMLANFRGMLVAVNFATKATRELAAELDLLDGDLEGWIPTQEWRSLLSVEVPLAHLGLSRPPADDDAGADTEGELTDWSDDSIFDCDET